MSWIVIVANLGAIAGGLTFGHFSEKIGRVNAITIAAIIALPAIYLWAFSATPVLLAIGAFIMQVAVQGAWGVIPVHLNELSPGNVRGTFPGFTYQLGNLITAYAAQWEAAFATKNFPLPGTATANYGHAMQIIMLGVFVVVFIVTAIGPEKRGISFTEEAKAAA